MARRIRKSRADIQRWNQMVDCLRLMNFAFTNVRLYPATHPEVVGTVTKLHENITPMVEEMEDIGFGFMDEMLYVEGAMSLEETANNQMLVDRFTRCRIKYLTFMKGITKEDLIAFFQVVNAEATKPQEEKPGEILEKKGVQTVHIVEAELDEMASKSKLGRKKTLLDWYEKAVATYQEAQNQCRADGHIDLKPMYRLVDDMSATIRNKGYEPYLLLPILGKGLDPHACHSVNVAFMACSLGELYGLNSGQINTLSICALLHDFGRIIIPVAWTERKTPLTQDEKEMARQHTVWGSLILLGKEALPPHVGLLAGRHHEDLSVKEPKDGYLPDIFHQLIAAADYYDLAFIGEKYYWKKHRSDRILYKLLNHRGCWNDATILKLLTNCVGFYPVGSLVLLNDGRKGIVVKPNAVHLARPKLYLFEKDIETSGKPQVSEPVPQAQENAPEIPDEAPPDILDLTEVNETRTGFKYSIASVLTPPKDMDMRKILDRKKEYLLSPTL